MTKSKRAAFWRLSRGLALTASLYASGVAAQSATTECSTIGRITRCDSQASQPMDYGATIRSGMSVVPDIQEHRERDLRIRRLELETRMLERQSVMQAAPGYNAKQCRNAARTALAENDLKLARDVLVACTHTD